MLPSIIIALHCNSTMSSPLLVKISRDGKEIGTYEAQEAVQLRADGTLKGTDFYWHEGMPNWAPMTEFLASESGRKLADEEALQRKQEKAKEAEAHLAKIKAKEAEQLAYRIAKDKEAEQIAVEKAKAKEAECAAVEAAIRALKIQKRAEESLETDYGGFFTALGVIFLIVGGIVLLKALGGDDDGSAIRQQVRTLQMTNGILLMILGCIIAKR
ncbi:MAG: domain 2 [Verrucomicrobiota bacterium]|jgi:hypothetical protein